MFGRVLEEVASELAYLQGQGEAPVLFETAVGFVYFDKCSQMLPALVKIDYPGFDLLIELDIEIYTTHAQIGMQKFDSLTEFFFGNHDEHLLIPQDLLLYKKYSYILIQRSYTFEALTSRPGLHSCALKRN